MEMHLAHPYFIKMGLFKIMPVFIAYYEHIYVISYIRLCLSQDQALNLTIYIFNGNKEDTK